MQSDGGQRAGAGAEGRLVNSIQDVKDTFYGLLRDRIAAGNAGRTLVVRGTVRPAVLVVENELPGGAAAVLAVLDAFSLRWTAFAVEADGLVKLTCEVHYATEGTTAGGGMDRGRALAAMDSELGAALSLVPMSADCVSLAEAGGATVTTATGTRVFWSDVAFGPAVIRGARMERTATVEVMGYE